MQILTISKTAAKVGVHPRHHLEVPARSRAGVSEAGAHRPEAHEGFLEPHIDAWIEKRPQWSAAAGYRGTPGDPDREQAVDPAHGEIQTALIQCEPGPA